MHPFIEELFMYDVYNTILSYCHLYTLSDTFNVKNETLLKLKSDKRLHILYNNRNETISKLFYVRSAE